jgi:ABC-type transport system involved in Fe-S cluster assembly fused permease/ATPase subunit
MTQRLLWPLTRLGNTLDMYQRAMASTNRVMNLLDTKPQIVEGAEDLPLEDVRGEIVFDKVSFAYGDGRHALRNLSLTMPAGQTALPLSGPPAPAKAPWSSCSSASTTCSRDGLHWTAVTCATSNLPPYAGRLAS